MVSLASTVFVFVYLFFLGFSMTVKGSARASDSSLVGILVFI